MKEKIIAALAIAGAALSLLLNPGVSSADEVVGEHAFQIAGVSTIYDTYKYVVDAPYQCDRNGADLKPISDPTLCKDAFGIPKPKMDASYRPIDANPGGSCAISRNLGPVTGPLFAGGRVYQPCAGKLTHTTHTDAKGCHEATNPAATCYFQGGETWFYGYCGQTYGGASGIDFHFSGADYIIDRMGFTRPAAGVWEFNGRLRKSTSPVGQPDGYVKLYLSAVPSPDQSEVDKAGGCEALTAPLHAIWWQGTAVVSDNPALITGVIAAKKPGWHWCDGTASEGC